MIAVLFWGVTTRHLLPPLCLLLFLPCFSHLALLCSCLISSVPAARAITPKPRLAGCWQAQLCHYSCLPVKRVSGAGSFPFLPLAWLPMHCLTLPGTSCSAPGEGWERAPGSAPHAGPPARPEEDPGPLERIPTVRTQLCGIGDIGVALHTPLGHLGLLLPHLLGKLQLPLVTVKSNSLLLVLSVCFGEGWDARRLGELGHCTLLSPLVLSGVVCLFL